MENEPIGNEATVVTEDTFAELEPDTVSEEAIVDAMKEGELPDEQFNDALPKEIQPEPALKAEGEEPKGEEKEKKHKPFVKDRDGKYILTRADGSKIELLDDEVSGIASRRVNRIAAQREALAAELAHLHAQQAPAPAEPIQSAPDQKEPDWESGEWESLSAFNKAWYDWRKGQEAPAPTREAAPVSSAPAEPPPPPQYLVEHTREVVEDGVKRFGQDFVKEVVNNAEAPFDIPFLDLVLHTAEDPTEVLWHLAHDLEQAKILRQTMQNEGPVLAARSIGRFEARLESQRAETPVSEATRVPPRLSAAPPPTPVIKSRGAVGPARSLEALAQNQKDYERWRKENRNR